MSMGVLSLKDAITLALENNLDLAIARYNLPIADDDIRRRAEAAGLEWRGSYVRYLVRYWLALPLEECRAGRS